MSNTASTVNKGHDVSKFWLGSDAYSRYGNIASNSGPDLVELASFRKAVANFVRITTGEDIPVKFAQHGHDTSYTDGESVVLSAKLDDALLDVNVGLALHEASHILLSDFKLLKKLLGPDWGRIKTKRIGDRLRLLSDRISHLNPQQTDIRMNCILSEIKNIFNIIEDRRIDQYIYDNAPGYRGYYQKLYEHYFYAESIDLALKHKLKSEPTWSNYVFHICNIINPNIQLDTLPKLERIYKMIDLQNIRRLKSSADCLILAIDIAELLLPELIELLAPQPAPQPKQDNADNTQESTSGSVPTQDSKQDNPDTNDKPDNPDTNESGSDTPGSGLSKDQERIIQKQLSKDMQKQDSFVSGRVHKTTVTYADKSQLEAIAGTNLTIQDVGVGGTGVPKIKCLVVNELTHKLVRNSFDNPIVESMLASKSQCNNSSKHMAKYDYDSTRLGETRRAVIEGINIGKRLGKKLKLRNESNELKSTRQRTGGMDKRLVAEIGYGAEAVFSKLTIKTVNPITIHYSIDASGSMIGYKFNSAMRSAAAIAKAASMIDGVRVVISFRGTAYLNAGTTYPVMLIGYDSAKNSIAHIRDLMSHVRPNGATPEGLCFEAIMKNLENSVRGNTEGIFVNISDGEPGMNYKLPAGTGFIQYKKDTAYNHTKAQVNQIRKLGYKVISYFVSDVGRIPVAETVDAFNLMYGKNARFVDVNDVNALASTLNEIILAPAYAIR